MRYKEEFIQTYIRTFDIYISQLVDMRNKIFQHAKIDQIPINRYTNTACIDTFEWLEGDDKWQEIFDNIIRKVTQNILEFNDLNAFYLQDLSRFDFDKKILRSAQNS